MKLYSSATLIFSIWAISIFVLLYFGFSSIPRTDLFPGNFLRNLANWDGGHYLGIAQNSYAINSQYVFFPLFPLFINLVSRITGDFLTAGLLISLISTLLAINSLYQLVSLDFGKVFAPKVLLMFLSFPLSFHFLTVYSESLFLLLVITTFLFMRKRKLFLATITASLASATRLSGLAIVLSLIFSILLTEKINRKNWFVLLSPVGFLLYCYYLYNRTGDPFYFIQAESHFWQGGLVIPGSSFLYSLKQLLTPNFIVNNFRNLLDFLFATFGILMVIKVSKKLSLDYTIFSIVSLVLPFFSPTIVALPRYLLTIFPIFIVLSFIKNQYLITFYQFISLMLLSVYAILFINGYWVS